MNTPADTGADFERLGDLLGRLEGHLGELASGAAPECSPRCPRRPSELEGACGQSSTAPSGPLRSGTTGSGRPPVASDSSGRAQMEPAQVLAARWPQIVGEEVAANARPAQLKGGRLVVVVSSSAWAQTLHFMSDTIVARVNECLRHATGDAIVKTVVFRHAGWEAPEARPSPPRLTSDGASGARTSPAAETAPAPGGAALSSEQRAALAEVAALALSPALRERILRAMEAGFVRGEQDSVR